jgi:hypothetical protein
VAAVLVEDLCMTYRAPIRESGWKATLGSVFHRRYRDVPAARRGAQPCNNRSPPRGWR